MTIDLLIGLLTALATQIEHVCMARGVWPRVINSPPKPAPKMSVVLHFSKPCLIKIYDIFAKEEGIAILSFGVILLLKNGFSRPVKENCLAFF